MKNADSAGRLATTRWRRRVGDFRSNGGCLGKHRGPERKGAPAMTRIVYTPRSGRRDGARRPVPARSAVREVVVVRAAQVAPIARATVFCGRRPPRHPRRRARPTARRARSVMNPGTDPRRRSRPRSRGTARRASAGVLLPAPERVDDRPFGYRRGDERRENRRRGQPGPAPPQVLVLARAAEFREPPPHKPLVESRRVSAPRCAPGGGPHLAPRGTARRGRATPSRIVCIVRRA